MNINVLTSTNHRSDLKRARKSQKMEIRLNIFSGQIKFESHGDYFCKKVLLNVKRGRPDATSWSCLMKEDERKSICKKIRYNQSEKKHHSNLCMGKSL
jgi:hypothetical protein